MASRTSAAVVVITHDSARVLDACLDAIRGVSAETIVVDNASRDSSVTIARRHAATMGELQVIANAENRGFAGAANQGFSATRSDCVLLLNPDAILLPPADLNPMIEACREYGMASGLLLGMDGAVQRGFFARMLPTALSLSFEALGLNRLWPSNPVNRKYRCLDLAADREAFVEQPPGAFLMIRRDVWMSLGGLDESFFPVWFEDADFCRRAIDAGFRIRFVPSCRVRHEGGHSVLRLGRERRELLWYGSLLRYAAKHCTNPGFGIVCLAVAAGAVGRAAAGCIEAGFSPEVCRKYGMIIRMAFDSWRSGKVPPGGLAQANEKSVVTAVEQ